MSFAPDILTPSTEGVGHEIALEAISHPMVRQGYAYWNEKRKERPFPERAEIAPREIRNLLPNIILVRVIDGGADYEFKIVGQANVIAHGFNVTNARVDALDRQVDGYARLMRQIFGRVLTGVPFASRGALKHINRAYRRYESLYLPLGAGVGHVDHIFTVAGYSGEIEGGLLP
jgi:hypothetical protein